MTGLSWLRSLRQKLPRRRRRATSQGPEAQALVLKESPVDEVHPSPLAFTVRNGSHSSNIHQQTGVDKCDGQIDTDKDQMTTMNNLETQVVETKISEEEPYKYLWEIAVSELSKVESKHVR